MKFRAKFEVLPQNNFGQSSLISLEIRLFYRKLNSRNWGNSLSVFHRNSPKYSNDQRGKLDWNWLKFYGERNAGFLAITAPRLQTMEQTLTTSKHSIEFTDSDFPGHFKVNCDLPALTFRRWKCKRGKRLTANFQERNLGTALSGKKIRPVGRIVKSWTSWGPFLERPGNYRAR